MNSNLYVGIGCTPQKHNPSKMNAKHALLAHWLDTKEVVRPKMAKLPPKA